MKIGTLVRTTAMIAGVAGAAVLTTGCDNVENNKAFVKQSGISATAFDSLEKQNLSGVEYWQSQKDSVYWTTKMNQKEAKYSKEIKTLKDSLALLKNRIKK